MSETCPNCAKPVLASDTTCWHCGAVLPKRAKAKAADSPPTVARVGPLSRERAINADADADYDLRAVGIYGLLTLALVVALGLVMHALGQQPTLVRSTALGGDWVTVADSELRYILSLPTDWQWLDMSYRDQSDLLATVIERQPTIGRALAPLGAAAGDVAIVAVAAGTQNLQSDRPIPFVVVGRSERLRQLAPQAVLDLLAEQGLAVAEAAIDTHLAGQPQARFAFNDAAAAYRCRHLFVAQPQTAAYLLAACAPRANYGTLQDQLVGILDTFQLLQQ
jgi:hypothetical protein